MSNDKLREFSEWLDTYRDLPVHEVFHEIVLRYEEALATTEPDHFEHVLDMVEPSQPVTLTNFDAIPDEVIDSAQEKSGMYRVELMRAWDAIIAALREKQGGV